MPKTLLLADDSVVIQKLVGLSFANEDVRLVTTDNGDDAVAKARELRPDVVLADVVMPGMSGYDVCDAIKRDAQLAHTPVLLLTGTFEAFDEERARRVRSDGHITKPFEAQALVDRVNALLAEQQSQQLETTAPTSEEAFDFFDEQAGGKPGTDVTTTAPARPPARPAPPRAAPPPAVGADVSDGLGAGRTFDFDDGDALPPLDDDGLLDESFDLDFSRRGPGGEQTVALMPEEEPVFERPSQPGATATSHAFDAFEDDDEALQAREASAAHTTIIMSDGDASSDGIAYGEGSSGVSSLDESLAMAETDPTASGDELLMQADDDLLGDASDSSPFDLGGGPVSEASHELDARTPSPDETILADDLFGDTTPPPGHARPAATPPPAPPAQDEGFDFGGSDSFAAPATDPFARSGHVSPPPLAGDYDVSSSDLGSPLGDAAVAVEEDFAADAEPSAEEISLSEGLLGAELGGWEAAPEEPLDDEAMAGDTQPRPAATPDITPVMRERVHDTLERIAWEAFADLSETMVKQVLQKVEAIAWEVIPQMAEALIKEEIRRMKAEDED